MRHEGDGLGERSIHGHGYDLEVGGSVIVRDEPEIVPADPRVIEVILDAVAARPDNLEPALGVGGIEHARLARDARGRFDHEVGAAASAPGADPVALVGFVKDGDVIGARRADAVAPDGVGPPRIVDGRVEDEPAAGVEEGTRGRLGDLVGQRFARREVADAQRVALVALGIDGVQQRAAVIAHIERAE